MIQPTACPICHKEGIPNFLENDVVCPCCGNDLTIFRKINKAKHTSGRTILLLCSIVACLVMAIALTAILMQRQINHHNATIAQQEEQITALKSTIDSLAVATQEASIPDKEIYVVQPGDKLWAISKTLFGTVKKWQTICSLNNITEPYNIYVGDTLRVK